MVTDDNDLLAKLDRLGAAALGQPPALGPVPERGDERTVRVYLDDARAVRAVDALPEGETRLLGVKRTIMRLGQLYLHRQARYNDSLLEAVSHLNDQVALLRARMGTELGRAATAIAGIDASLDELNYRIDELARDGGPALRELADAHLALRGTVNALSADIERTIADIRTTTPPAVSDEAVSAIVHRARRRSDSFYERFEDAMRGSADSVKARLEPYLADLEAKRDLDGLIVDIGCGRGEWLDLLRENGFDAIGIDFNEEAVARCTERGLNAIVGDAIEYLRAAEPDSVMAVTGFHIIEHVEPDLQIEMVEAAWRALKPGGLLILETPNPTNLTVGAASFYSDPSHLRPVDPGYLWFVYSDLGYVGVEVRYLNPREDFTPPRAGASDLEGEVMTALRGPRDFAVIGRKPADLTDRSQ